MSTVSYRVNAFLLLSLSHFLLILFQQCHITYHIYIFTYPIIELDSNMHIEFLRSSTSHLKPWLLSGESWEAGFFSGLFYSFIYCLSVCLYVYLPTYDCSITDKHSTVTHPFIHSSIRISILPSVLLIILPPIHAYSIASSLQGFMLLCCCSWWCHHFFPYWAMIYRFFSYLCGGMFAVFQR